MTFLGSNAAKSLRIMEGEFSMFCRLSAEVSAIIQAPNRPLLGGGNIHELRDELDVLSEMTEWPALRKSTRTTIERIDCFLVDQPKVVFA
jgi:hypothetical protein